MCTRPKLREELQLNEFRSNTCRMRSKTAKEVLFLNKDREEEEEEVEESLLLNYVAQRFERVSSLFFFLISRVCLEIFTRRPLALSLLPSQFVFSGDAGLI